MPICKLFTSNLILNISRHVIKVEFKRTFGVLVTYVTLSEFQKTVIDQNLAIFPTFVNVLRNQLFVEKSRVEVLNEHYQAKKSKEIIYERYDIILDQCAPVQTDKMKTSN